MDDFDLELKRGFLDEAKELLDSAEQCFLNLEHAHRDPAILEQIFRLAHSLKGSAGAVGFAELGAFTHVLESFLLKLKERIIGIQPEVVTLLLECSDFLAQSLDNLKMDFDYRMDGSDLILRLSSFQSGAALPADAEETVTHPLAPIRAEADEPAKPASKTSSGDESIRVQLSKIDQLLNSVGELVILQTVMNQQKSKIVCPFVQKNVDSMAKIIKEIQSTSMGLRMIPLKQTFQKMQRIVRDTSEALAKEINLQLAGEETELDKTVIERLSDPLVHLVRNAVDHGIETPEARRNAGKSAQGNIFLSAYHRGNQIVVEVSDDGKGLDAQALIQKAKEKGILDSAATLTDDEAYQLIFEAGFSTKTQVTDISGRGVGMDVVKTNIRELQGEIEVTTEKGKGSCFRIVLPLTLAIIDGFVVTLEKQRYVIPKAQVLETFRPSPGDIGSVQERGEILNLRGDFMPLFRMENLLGRRASDSGSGILLVIADEKNGAFSVMVDDVIGQQQVVVKRLGNELRGIPGLSGAAILGDGKAALIIDLLQLKSSKKTTPQMKEAL